MNKKNNNNNNSNNNSNNNNNNNNNSNNNNNDNNNNNNNNNDNNNNSNVYMILKIIYIQMFKNVQMLKCSGYMASLIRMSIDSNLELNFFC